MKCFPTYIGGICLEKFISVSYYITYTDGEGSKISCDFCLTWNWLQRTIVEFGRLNGKPVIPGAIAQIDCEVSAEHVEGDHTLVIGKVTDIHLEDKEALIFYSGKYRSLKEEKTFTDFARSC